MITECRLCGSRALGLWMRDGPNRDLNYYRCRDCRLWNYDLDCGLDQTQYTSVYKSPQDPDHKPNRHNHASWQYLRERLTETGTLLDIGCGNGSLMYYAKNDGWTVSGIELSETMAAAVREDTGLQVEVGAFPNLDHPKRGYYDLVVLRHVLEHIPDSRHAMTLLRAMLRDGGHALLEFPNTRSTSYLFKRWRQNWGLQSRRRPDDWRPGHCNEFCRSAFTYLAHESGFDLVDWQTYSNKPLSNAIYRLFPIGSNARALVRKRH